MNILAIIVCAIIYFILGFLFHGPIFGKLWMKLAKITPTGNEKFSDMYGKMVANLIVNIILAVVLAGTLWIADSSPLMGGLTWYKGAIIAAWLWLGLIVPVTILEVIWMGRTFKLWLFEAVTTLFSIAVIGALLAIWR